MIAGPSMFHRCRLPPTRGARLVLGMLMLVLLIAGLPRGGLHAHPPAGSAPDALHQVLDTLAHMDHAADSQPAGDGGHTDPHQGLHAHDVTTPATFLGPGRSGALTYLAPDAWIRPVDALPLDSIKPLPLQRPPIA